MPRSTTATRKTGRKSNGRSAHRNGNGRRGGRRPKYMTAEQREMVSRAAGTVNEATEAINEVEQRYRDAVTDAQARHREAVETLAAAIRG